MYVPWQPIDVIRQGRIRWNRLKTVRSRYGLHGNSTYWKIVPQLAPFVTGYGVLVSKVHYKYSGVTPGLRTIYNGFTHDLSWVLAKYNIKDNSFWKRVAGVPWLRGYYGYMVANDLFNRVNARSIRAIVSASSRLSNRNLSKTEKRKIAKMIGRSINLICVYDFSRDFLYKP